MNKSFVKNHNSKGFSLIFLRRPCMCFVARLSQLYNSNAPKQRSFINQVSDQKALPCFTNFVTINSRVHISLTGSLYSDCEDKKYEKLCPRLLHLRRVPQRQLYSTNERKSLLAAGNRVNGSVLRKNTTPFSTMQITPKFYPPLLHLKRSAELSGVKLCIKKLNEFSARIPKEKRDFQFKST